MKLSLVTKNGKELWSATGKTRVFISRKHYLEYGDYFKVEVEKAPCFLWVQLDAAIRPALIYLTKSTWIFKVPLLPKRDNPYPPGSFMTRRGYSWIRIASEEEINANSNVSQNPYDQHENTGAFPHANANAETRNEDAFFAKNAIDGVLANTSHGNYPFESWGIDGRKDAKLRINLGRKVSIKKIGIIERADFPHDTYWKTMTIKFGDNKFVNISLKKSTEEQFFELENINTSYVELVNLIPENSKKFAALTQVEIFKK